MLKEFEIDNSIAQMTEYNKPITCNDPNDGENNQENINCNRNMNKNRITITQYNQGKCKTSTFRT